MSRFRYKGMTNAGEIQDGIMEGTSEVAAIAAVRQRGLWPIAISELTSRPGAQSFLRRDPSFSSKAMAAFFYELSTLLGSDITVERSLVMLANRNSNQPLAKATSDVLKRVRDGMSLGDALSANKAFPKESIGLIRAGEATGKLESSLLRLSDMMMRSAAIKSEILSALIYPTILLLTACLTISIVLTVVVPEFAPLFDDAGEAPPLAFRILIAVSNGLVSWGWLFVVVPVAGWLGLRRLHREKRYKRAWDRLKCQIPLLGNLLKETDIARFCRTLGTLIKSDVALPTALVISADVIMNTNMCHTIREVAKGLREGSRLSNRLASSGQFTKEALDLIDVGDESGRLSEMLLYQADLSERVVRDLIKRLLELMVPAITLFLGLIVGGIVTSLLVAILSINNLAVH